MEEDVAPFTGAWIETPMAVYLEKIGEVAPFTGAWIETPGQSYGRDWRRMVAPFTGAWIET